MMALQLIDSFLFFNELDLLKCRLKYLGDVVDQFIIIESTIDFQGSSRQPLLTPEVVASLPHADKVQVHVWEPSALFRSVALPLARGLSIRKLLWAFKKHSATRC